MSQTSQATTAVSEAQRGLRYRVLIVEDDADIRELIRYNLAQEGFMVGEAARTRSDGARPDAAGNTGIAGLPPDAGGARYGATADPDRDGQGHRGRQGARAGDGRRRLR